MSSSLVDQHRAEELESCEGMLRNALKTLDSTIGRAEVDNRGIGAAKFLVERCLQSLARVREKMLDDGEPVFEEAAPQ